MVRKQLEATIARSLNGDARGLFGFELIAASCEFVGDRPPDLGVAGHAGVFDAVAEDCEEGGEFSPTVERAQDCPDLELLGA